MKKQIMKRAWEIRKEAAEKLWKESNVDNKIIANIIGTAKNGCNGILISAPIDGYPEVVRVMWEDGSWAPGFIDYEAFEIWACPEFNTYVDSVELIS